MSSNAFARSRPRVRHQRVPRTHSCDHPRFTQLVNELSRLNDLKKKQEEVESGSADSCKNEDDSPVIVATSSTTCLTSNGNKISSGGSSSGIINSSNTNTNCSGSSSNGNGNIMNICSGINPNGTGVSCCSSSVVPNTPQTSNGYRSLDRSQSSISSNLHDNYHQQNHHHHQHQHIFDQHHPANHNNHLHHNHQHQHQFHHHEPNHLVQQQQQQQQSDDRCLAKCSTSSFGYSKQNLVLEQAGGAPNYLNSNTNISSNLDLRQDENRSKRKRSANEASNSKKSSMSSCSNASSKRHKTSEAIRPLSPSFTKCPICLLDCMDRDPSFTNTCFHLFCYVCIESWTKNKATCPLCRTKFTKIIYKIKSATNYEEKVASPIRRDDDEGYADRFMLDQLSNLNQYNSAVPSRNNNSDEVQFLFENLSRNAEVQQSYFVNQIDPRQGESLHSFNTVTAPPGFILNVPHPTFGWMAPIPGHPTAITGAYPANTSLTNINNESTLRRMSRSGRYIYSRTNYDTQSAEGPDRVTRASNVINQPAGVIPLERHSTNQHHHTNSHQNQHHQHRATIDMATRPHRIEQSHTSSVSLPYSTQARHYNQPNVGYSRRPYNNTQMEHHQQQQHILESLYRQMPDM